MTEEYKELKDLLRRAVEGEETALEVINKITDGKPEASLSIIRRKLNREAPEAPERAETKARAHTFLSGNGLAEYLMEYGTSDTVIYIDQGKSSVQVVLNEGAEGGVEILSMRPQAHPRWKPWANLHDEEMNLQDFVSFLRNNLRAIVEPSGRELLLSLSQIRSSTEIELQVGSGAKTLNGLMVKNTIQGDSAEGLIDLPETITIETPVIVGGLVERIELDVILRAGSENNIIASFASSCIIEAEIKAFEEIELRLSAVGKEKKCVVTHGVPMYGNWNYIHH